MEQKEHKKTKTHKHKSRTRRKRQVRPPRIEPELLLFVDYALYRDFDGDSNELLEYLLHFWHAVSVELLITRKQMNSKSDFNDDLSCSFNTVSHLLTVITSKPLLYHSTYKICFKVFNTQWLLLDHALVCLESLSNLDQHYLASFIRLSCTLTI